MLGTHCSFPTGMNQRTVMASVVVSREAAALAWASCKSTRLQAQTPSPPCPQVNKNTVSVDVVGICRPVVLAEGGVQFSPHSNLAPPPYPYKTPSLGD